VLILDRLLTGLHDACAAFPDKRKGAGDYSMADIGLSAFSLFFMQSESFLSYQRSLEEGRKTSANHGYLDVHMRPERRNAVTKSRECSTRQCSECYGDRMLVAISMVDASRAECFHNFRVLA